MAESEQTWRLFAHGDDAGRLVCEVIVRGDPVPKGRPRHDRGGNTYTPARTVAAEQAVAWELLAARRPQSPTDRPVVVVLSFRCQTRRRCDIDNLAKLVLDAGNGVLWVDDQQVVRLVVNVERGVDNPDTYICVTEAG